MKTYRYRIVLEVEVPAFDVNDADAAVEDAFGVGEDCGVNITRSKVTFKGEE